MSDQDKKNAPTEDKPVTPLDMLITKLQHWVEEQEKCVEEAEKYSQTPDDVPCFVSRYS